MGLCVWPVCGLGGRSLTAGILHLSAPNNPNPSCPRRDAAVSELRNTSAGEDERQRMLEILQRLHQQEVEEGGSGGSDDDGEEGGGSGDDDEEGGGLSSQTLHRLLAKVGELCMSVATPRASCEAPLLQPCIVLWQCSALQAVLLRLPGCLACRCKPRAAPWR